MKNGFYFNKNILGHGLTQINTDLKNLYRLRRKKLVRNRHDPI